MKIDTKRYRAPKGKLKLHDYPTGVDGPLADDDKAERELARCVKRIAELQELLYAGDRWSLLLVFQAMDAAGKDGTIKHVLSGVNPAGCQVFSFKQPSATELEHDFLWRTTLCLPERGRIGVFNRSYYEEVLVVRVHPEYLVPQRLPEGLEFDSHFWKQRYRSIRDYEAHLARSGTRIVKFFLNVSREEQRRRFLDRLDEPDKNWKFSLGDVQERQRWDDYQEAYRDCIAATHTPESPWYLVPADDKRAARLIVARVIVETLEDLKLAPPTFDKRRRQELRAARALLEKQAP
jgi:PPK2 family polyphosphate:nucleotide phosphotransferase